MYDSPDDLLSRLSPLHWLCIILLVTALQWCGSACVGLSTDDYHYIHHLAPLDNAGDVLKAFLKSDANPQYWRPVSNATLTSDFLLYGWRGGCYHITNLLLHLIATALVYFSCKRLFRLDDTISLITAAIFGISAGHDSNLLWIAARGDILVTIFSLATLLLIRSGGWSHSFLAILCYFLALCSKELAFVVLPLIALTYYTQCSYTSTGRRLRSSLLQTLPFVASAIIYLVIRGLFTVPATEAQPMLGEGMQSPLSAVKNVVYGVGYLVAPLDLSSAVTVLTTYKTQGLIIACTVALMLCWTLWKNWRSLDKISLVFPAILTLCFLVTVAQSFERWRLYAPSVGLYSIIAILAVHLCRRSSSLGRTLLILIGVMFAGFHTYRAAIEKQSWRLASEVLQDVKNDYKILIAKYGERPLFLITQPSKIGGGSIMKVSSNHIVLQAKAELLRPVDIARGAIRDVGVDHQHALLVLALDPDEGFAPISVTEISPMQYRVTVPEGSSTRIQPEQSLVGSTARENTLHDGDTLEAYGGTVIINKADRAYATDVTLISDLKNTVPIYFDGKRVRELR